jgi:magnesium chelatase family protein
MEAYPVEVEVSIASGLPAFTIVGLPDPSIQEARERVRSAIESSAERWPMRRVTVNLSPAHLRKHGSGFDLAMALAVLCADGRISQERLRSVAVIGELSLDGAVRRVRGVLAATMAAVLAGKRAVMVPQPNAPEAALVAGVDVLPARHLGEVVRFFRGERRIDAYRGSPHREDPAEDDADLSDVRGQDNAKRALEIAAAGGHNLLMMGPPGGGKTMLARRLPGVMPRLSDAEAFEVTRLYSVAGLLPDEHGLVRRRPFRAPHHTVSTGRLVGGGSGVPQPGEVSLAHRGVLFLDELGEFKRDALQALRGPMEDGWVSIVRARWSVTYPARFQLVAASNPCGCGYRGDLLKGCDCSPGSLSSFRERLSGPILDRIDVQIEVGRPTRQELFGSAPGESSAVVRRRVAHARAIQHERLASRSIASNAEIPPRSLVELCVMDPSATRDLHEAVDAFAMSARGAHRAIRVARTIADLAGADRIGREAVAEALGFRLSFESLGAQR